jgi:hypothetical protein
MLKPEACEDLKLEAKPRISVSSLLNVRKLIVDDGAHACAESASGGRDAQKGESDDTAARDSLRRRRTLDQTPESVQESCRSLWKELLTAIAKKDEQRQYERED